MQTAVYRAITAIFTFALTLGTTAVASEKVQVFYPPHYKAAAHSPSFALLHEPTIESNRPTTKLRPTFYQKKDRAIASFCIEKGTSLYGTGEVNGALLRNDSTVRLWNTDNFKYSIDAGRRLYQSHPWVMGVKADGSAFGILADNTWKQEIQLTDSIRFISEGPANRMIVIERKTPQEVVEALAELTGKMQLPPLWALGYQQCRYSYVPDTRIKSIADTFRLKNLPCDVIWMDIDYMERYKIFTFDSQKIPDPKALNDYLHQKGFHTVWMIDPGVKVEKGYAVYEQGSKGDHWVKTNEGKEFNGKVWPGQCAFPDFTRPQTREWWKGLYTDFMATGIDGVWNDMNEPSVFDGPDGTMPADNYHRGGGDLSPDVHLRYHNIYGMLMVKASREGILRVNPTKRPFILSRSGYVGSQRYAATWTGDNGSSVEHMKMSIPMTINLGLSGQPFNGPDMGGFALNANGDLFAQWVGFGVFFPFVRGHATNDVNNKEPWAFGPAVEKVSQTALNRRYRLLPYYYTLFREAAQTGIPVMRPVFFADLTNPTLRAQDSTFLIGNGLLVSPCWASRATMPHGIWRQFQFIDETVSDNYQATLKLRGGTILPTARPIQHTNEYRTDSLTLYISPDNTGKAQGTLYEDAGEGYEFQKGGFSLTRFSATTSGNTICLHRQKLAGKMSSHTHTVRLVVLTDRGIQLSEWTKINSNTLNIPIRLR